MKVIRCDKCKAVYTQDEKFFTIGESTQNPITREVKTYAINISTIQRYYNCGQVHTSKIHADLCKDCIQELVALEVGSHGDPEWLLKYK